MFQTHELISPAYACLQRQLHGQPRGYGGRGDKWADTVLAILADIGATSVLDYGCGQGSLKRAIDAVKPSTVVVREYDPAIPGKDAMPLFADLVVCTDVLEHIEPDRLDAVLAHLKFLARMSVFAVVSLKASNKVLADGRNAHLVIQPAAWWLERFAAAGFTARVRHSHALELVVLLLPQEASV